MKKFTTWIVYLVFLAGFLPTPGNAQLPNSQTLSFQELSQTLRSPEEIARFMWRHFQFEEDRTLFGREEYWQTPEEMLSTRKGDCEDFAYFAHVILKQNGISSFLINIYSDRFAHTVVVFKEKKGYSAIDGTTVIHSQSKDLNDLISRIYPFWKTGAIVSVTSSRQGRILKQFSKI